MTDSDEENKVPEEFYKSKIQEISISELNFWPISFNIPSYQRGYRWTTNEYKNGKLIKGEIEHLLDDLWAFANPQKKEWDTYCLQPIVLQKKDSEYWIIDGQQRLTTISIIQWALIQRFPKLKLRQNWSIRCYKSNELLDSILSKYIYNPSKDAYNIEDATINDFYRSKALNAIWQWLKTKQGESEQLRNFINLFADSSLNSSKRLIIIKYLLGKSNDMDNRKEIGLAAFERLNDNKIPLTSGELIKALFMGQGNSLNEHMKLEISKEWELIERTLQNDQYWYMFKTDGIENTSTRIELIFAIVLGLTENEFKNSKHDRTLIFRRMEEKSENTSLDDIWKEVRYCFWWVQSCYKNVITFNLLGWLRLFTSNYPTTIYKCWKEAGSKFNAFNLKLKKDMIRFNDVLQIVFDEAYNLDTIDKLDKNKDIYNNSFDKKALRKFFVILNIQSCINAGERFRFDLYVKILRDNNYKGWHIEHIDSRDESKSQENRDNTQVVVKDSLCNLVLLNYKTNEGYGNGSYQDKRKYVKAHLHSPDHYYPPCTRNAILKFYSADLRNSDQWSSKDGNDYAKEMIGLMKQFLQEN